MPDNRFYQAWDDEVLERRINIAKRFTPEISVRLVEALNAPLLRLLSIERQNKGGAPGKRYRNTVVDQLASIYQKIYAESPRSTPEGKFATMCSLVLEEVGLNIDGLESAIRRRLKKLTVT